MIQAPSFNIVDAYAARRVKCLYDDFKRLWIRQTHSLQNCMGLRQSMGRCSYDG